MEWFTLFARDRDLKFICSENATKFCEIFTLLLSSVVPVKSKVKISQNFVAFSEYMNFNFHEGKTWLHIYFDSDPNDVIVYIRPSISLSIILLQRKRIWGLPPGQPTRDQQRSTWCIEKALCSNLQKNVLKILVMVVVFCKI